MQGRGSTVLRLAPLDFLPFCLSLGADVGEEVAAGTLEVHVLAVERIDRILLQRVDLLDGLLVAQRLQLLTTIELTQHTSHTPH